MAAHGGRSDQEGGLSTTDALGLSSGAPPGTSAGWTFTAAAGTTVTGITYERYIGHESDPDNYWTPALRANGAIVPGETCLDSVQNGETCFVGGPPGEGGEPGTLTGLSAQELSLGIVCRAPTGEECVTGATLHAAWATMYGARVTLSDPTPPTLNTPSGALWGPGEADGFHKGTESVTVAAQDVGGGVASIVLAVDGHPVETYNASCNFTFAQPCPVVHRSADLGAADHRAFRRYTHAHARRHRCGGQSVDRRLRADHGREQSSASARRAHGDGDAGRCVHVYGDLGRSVGAASANHGSDLPGVSGERLWTLQCPHSGARGRACDGDGPRHPERGASQCG